MLFLYKSGAVFITVTWANEVERKQNQKLIAVK